MTQTAFLFKQSQMSLRFRKLVFSSALCHTVQIIFGNNVQRQFLKEI